MRVLRIIKEQIQLNIKEALSYKMNCILQIVCIIVSNMGFVGFWYILFNSSNGMLGNYYFGDIMYLWGITSIGYGVCFFCCAGVAQIGIKILDGSLDSYILQPCPTLLGAIISKSDFSAIGDIIFGVMLILLSQRNTGYTLLISMISSLTAAMVIHAAILIWNSLVFFFGNMTTATFMFLDILITLSTYPSEIFSGLAKAIMLSIIPAYFVSHIPLIVLNQHSLVMISLQIVFALASNFFGIIIFKVGLARYSSTGLITIKH